MLMKGNPRFSGEDKLGPSGFWGPQANLGVGISPILVSPPTLVDCFPPALSQHSPRGPVCPLGGPLLSTTPLLHKGSCPWPSILLRGHLCVISCFAQAPRPLCSTSDTYKLMWNGGWVDDKWLGGWGNGWMGGE